MESDGPEAARAGGPVADGASGAPTVPSLPVGGAAPTIRVEGGSSPAPTLGDSAGPGAGPGAGRPGGRRSGQYEWAEVLGRGGMGIVYKAYHPGLKCHYAVKALQAADAASADAVRRFHKEAEALARLRHPGIVGVHDIWEEEGRTYLAMEYVQGRTLDAHAAAAGDPSTGGGLTAREAVRVTAEIAEAIQYAHEMGVLHRDLKPGNVIVGAQGRVKVMDFGLARIVDAEGARVTRTGVLVGTPAYMSPEQVEEGMGAVDARSDVYQVGAILYELLTGQPPYSGAGAMETLMRVARGDPAPIRRVRPALERDAETICLKAMAREPAARYASARDLAEDCRRFLEGESIRARRATWRERSWRWARRRKALTGLAAAALAALALAGGFAWHARSVEREKADLEAQVLRALRMIARTNLDATLMVRRAGGSLREGRARFLAPLQEAVREATAKLPTLAEPHVHLGRMYRALLQFEEALREQEAALAKSPADPEALYERGLLLSHFLGKRALVLRDRWVKIEGRRIAAAGGLENPRAPDTRMRARPPDDELIAADPEARDLRDRLRADLERLERAAAAAPGALAPARLTCARGLCLLPSGRAEDRAEAKRSLEEAIATEAGLEEAYEALAWLLDGRGEYDAAVAVLDRGIATDPGYAPFWFHRGEAVIDRGRVAARSGRDPDAEYARADQDLTRAIELHPDAAEYRVRRGWLRTLRGISHEAYGRDPLPLYDAGLADLDEAVASAPDLTEARRVRGNTHLDVGIYLVSIGRDPDKHWEAAAADFDWALERDPGLAAAWLDRGNLHFNRAAWAHAYGGDEDALWARAEADFSRALTLDPGTAEGWRWRGMLRTNWGVGLDQRGQDPTEKYSAAMGDFDRALERDAGEAKIWGWRAGTLANWALHDHAHGRDPAPRCEQAVADATRSLELNPAFAEARTVRARALSQWGVALELRGQDAAPLHERALADLDQAVRGRADYAEAFLVRGMVRVNLGLFRRSQGQDPTDLWRGADEDYGRAIAANPKFLEAYMRRARVRTNLGILEQGRGGDPEPQFGLAVQDLEAAVALNPGAADVWATLGITRGNWGNFRAERGRDALPQFADAVAAFDQALQRNPSHGIVLLWRANTQVNWGQVLLDRGENPAARLDDAQATLERAAALNPAVAELWEVRGQVELQRAAWAERSGGDPRPFGEAAVPFFGRALEVNPKHVDAWWKRGKAHLLLGRNAEAVDDLEMAQRLNPRAAGKFAKLLEEARRRMKAASK